ncbi:ATP-dependent DNA ligase [Halovibrio variabilis]|uniref:DNA ligase (ATP) n=1 Tax=Halovibrio variabilis TaxID=31910 RepID=A0A511UNE3_9GAMM|nr:DNA ligase D [Halovibrio variabilis]GEN28087.1 ATP-dependent DNA ligase [Halovibrio variabilis]
MAKLKEYRRKRNFKSTPEPAGEHDDNGSEHGASGNGTAGNSFVVHKHAASHDHFDLRLEQQGVLRSWALPKGPSLEPGEKRLAIQVEDHPLEYADFEGVIPEDAYGGGTVMIWDRGEWKPHGEQKEGHLNVELNGGRLKGRWTLTRMKGGKGKEAKDDKQWLMIKRSDENQRDKPEVSIDEDSSIVSGLSMAQIAEDRDTSWTSQDDRSNENKSSEASIPDPGSLKGAHRADLPSKISPQLATLVHETPDADTWIHEVKLDGYRILARIENAEIRLITRNGKDWSDRLPRLAELLTQLPVKSALIDGEVVALDKEGTSSFRYLQEAMSNKETEDLVYQVFDLPYLEGYDLKKVPLIERKHALAQLLKAGGFKSNSQIRYSEHTDTQGSAFYQKACRIGLEGIISKRASSHYQEKRSKDWLKSKCVIQEEFIVGGYTDPQGSRSGFGSLLMGAFDKDDRLEYAGRVGTGFSSLQLESLSATLQKLETSRSPFNAPVPDQDSIHWVRPELVIDVEFTQRTRDGRLRHPSFRGLREDRNPQEIRMSRKKPSAATPSNGKPSETKLSDQRRTQRRASKDETEVLGVRLTHPDRILFPEQGLTKLDLARYYENIQDWILPHLARRPLSLVRCPQGRTDECFFQKHPRSAIPDSVPRVKISEKQGNADYLYVESAADLVGLVQAGALEIHPWGSHIDDVEHPDILVFDLDPSPGVNWKEILRVASTLRDRLESLGMQSFVRTTGGKGIHLVVPLVPEADWEQAKAFARAVAQLHASDDPERLTTQTSKTKREGLLFIDYLRNGRGNTAVASYSVRARQGAPVAVPVRWDELNAALRADRYSVSNLRRRLAALREDPWEGFLDAARPINTQLLKAVGL